MFLYLTYSFFTFFSISFLFNLAPQVNNVMRRREGGLVNLGLGFRVAWVPGDPGAAPFSI